MHVRAHTHTHYLIIYRWLYIIKQCPISILRQSSYYSFFDMLQIIYMFHFRRYISIVIYSYTNKFGEEGKSHTPNLAIRLQKTHIWDTWYFSDWNIIGKKNPKNYLCKKYISNNKKNETKTNKWSCWRPWLI